MKSEVHPSKFRGANLEITITVPANRVGEVLEEVIGDAAKEIEVKGFRKGQAPKNLVREKIDLSKAYGEVVNRLAAECYNAAVKEHLLKPIVSPQIEIIQFEPEAGKDFVFKATTAERPEVKLGDYKKKVVGDALTAVLSTSKVEIPPILTENEITRMLSRLIDQTARLGLTVEQYLQSQNKNLEQLRAEYKKQAEENLKAELVLEEIAQEEKIEVTDKEVEEAIKSAPDQKSREELAKEENKWYIRSVLKRNKTLQRLMELAK